MSTEYKDEQFHGTVSVESLISALGNANDARRWNARQSLLSIGPAAVPELIKALKDSSILVRWEVTQILAALADPAAAPALVETLGDDDSGVRWSAVGGLIALKERSLVPLLEGLMHQSKSILITNNAHHVLKNLPLSPELRALVTPVLDALGGSAPGLEVPFVARNALAKLEEYQGKM